MSLTQSHFDTNINLGLVDLGESQIFFYSLKQVKHLPLLKQFLSFFCSFNSTYYSAAY